MYIYKYIKPALKKHIVSCLAGCFLWLFTIEGQIFRPNVEVGGFAGVSYYLGDINPRMQFYNPGLALGAMVKYNLSEHHCLRFNMFYGQLKGNDLDFKNDFQQSRKSSFETTLLDYHIGYEFNFMPHVINRRKISHATPYIFFAAGYSLILSSNASTGLEAKSHATLPFGVGYKFRINDVVALGCEWGMRKTFTDNLDGVLNPGPDGSYSLSHNNDWYSFAGVFVTFIVYEKGFKCPGIKEQAKYK